MKPIVKYSKWWYRFIPKRRKELKFMQAIVSYIASKPKFQAEVKRRIREVLLYGRAK